MNLKDILSIKDNQPELYWALVIEKGLVQSGIWYVGEGKAEVIGIGTGIPWEEEDELIEATDAALSSAIQKLPDNYPEPTKTVFGVSTSWVKDGEISPENLGKIKKLCTDLSLTPVGFVVLPEAIAHFYKSEEGAPLNAIVLKADDNNLELSIFKLGTLSGTTEVSRSVSLVDDVIEGLSRFEGENPLPTRFVVYDGKEGDLEEIKQTLLQADWSEAKVSFLHTPQVETLSPDKKVMATALAGGSEIGDVTAVSSQTEDDEEDNPQDQNENLTSTDIETKNNTAEDFGFSVGEDISSLKKEDVENLQSYIPESPPIQDSTLNLNIQTPPAPKMTASDYITKSKSLFHSFSAKIFPGKTQSNVGRNKKLIAVGIALGSVLLFILSLWLFVQTAKVSIYVAPKRAEENVKITFDTKGSFDISTGLIPASRVTEEAIGEKTSSTTGTKLIGERAKGNVQIANGNSASINLSSGTIITSSSGFKFKLDNEASVSGQLLPGSPGTSNINVTAYDIGAQYNLAKGEVFSVGNYSKSLVAATSTNDFSGGSSQEISAVDKDDQQNLLEELKTELERKANASLSSKILGSQILVNDSANIEIVSEDFDHAIGDQADSLKLSLEIKTSSLAADREKLIEYAKSMLSNKTPGGYTLSSDQVDFKFTFVEEIDDKYVYDVVVGGNFLPAVDIEKVKKVISGKSITESKRYLDAVPGFDHADISLKIKLPGPFKTIPWITKHITVEVRPE